MGIILASLSPRRKTLLKLITEDFSCISENIPEIIPDVLDILKAPEFLALKKAEAVAVFHPEDTVIGADTAVFLDKKLLGKPKDKREAEKMLLSLSGKEHFVITGCAVIKGEVKKSFSVKTAVKFRTLSINEIRDYIENSNPLDKAGSYGIQDKGALFVEKIKGDYYNAVGLPVSRLYEVLKSF